MFKIVSSNVCMHSGKLCVNYIKVKTTYYMINVGCTIVVCVSLQEEDEGWKMAPSQFVPSISEASGTYQGSLSHANRNKHLIFSMIYFSILPILDLDLGRDLDFIL